LDWILDVSCEKGGVKWKRGGFEGLHKKSAIVEWGGKVILPFLESHS
jgi:hypothetical protein